MKLLDYCHKDHGNHWITLKLQGKTVSKDAQNSRVVIRCKEGNQVQDFHLTVGSGGSFGASSLQVEAGLGKFTSIESLEIWWGGNPKKKEIIKGLSIDRCYSIAEGDKLGKVLDRKVMPLKGDKAGGGCCKK